MIRLRLRDLRHSAPATHRAQPMAWVLAAVAVVAAVAVLAATVVRADSPTGALGVIMGLSGLVVLVGGLMIGTPGGVVWAVTTLTTGYALAVAASDGGRALEAPLVGVALVVVAVVGSWSFGARRAVAGSRAVLSRQATALAVVTAAGAAVGWLVTSIGLAGARGGLGTTVIGLCVVVVLAALGAERLRRLR